MNDLVWLSLLATLFAVVAILFARRRMGIEEYLTARNQLGAWAIAASVTASGMGAWILFSPPETGAVWGIAAVIGYAIGAAAPFAAFLLIGPRIRRLMPSGHSITEFVWHRYGPAPYLAVLLISVFYMSVFLAAELTGIAVAVNIVTGIPLWSTALVVAATTVAYTAYGGLPASIFTDKLQALLLVPLLALVFAWLLAAVGGLGAFGASLSRARPELLEVSYAPGLELGVALVIAVLAANLFHQGYWQRVFASRDEAALRLGYGIAAAASAAIVLAAGAIGLFAVAAGVESPPSASLFALAQRTAPPVLMSVVLSLGLVLVMSSLDTLLNGLASLVASDLHRASPQIGEAALLRLARVVTVALAAASVVIAAQGFSVLYLFLVADLVCAAAMIPVLAGLFLSGLDGRGALVAFGLGLLAGALFFPTPEFRGWLPLPMAGSTMVSFVAAVVVSSGAVAILDRVGRRFELSALAGRIAPMGPSGR